MVWSSQGDGSGPSRGAILWATASVVAFALASTATFWSPAIGIHPVVAQAVSIAALMLLLVASRARRWWTAGTTELPPIGGPPAEDPTAGVKRLPTHHRLAMYGGITLAVGILSAVMLATLGAAHENVQVSVLTYVYGGVLAASGIGLLLAAWIVRQRDGPAPAGPFWTDAQRPHHRIVVGGVAGAWAAPLLAFGSVGMVIAIPLLANFDGPVGWIALVAGFLGAATGLVLTWRDEKRQGRAVLPLMLMGFGFGAVSYGLMIFAAMRRLGAPQDAQMFPIALFAAGAVVFTLGYMRRDQEATVGLKRTGAFWAGFLIVLPAMAFGLAAAGPFGGTAGSSCAGVPTESPNGGLNLTVPLQSTGDPTGLVPALRGPAEGTQGFDPEPNTTFVLVRMVQGVEIWLEHEDDNGDWVGVPEGDAVDGFLRFGRWHFTESPVRVAASADAARDGTSQPLELVFHAEPNVWTCEAT